MTLFVRKLTNEEKIELNNWSQGMDEDLRHRSKVILLSSQGYVLKEIARLTNHHYMNLSKWINRFNEKGIMGLITQRSGGGSPKITEDDKKIILDLAKSKPRDLELPFTNWTLERLKEEANKQCIDISHEWIRQILIGEGYSYKKTKEWIDSPDPEYQVKKKAIKELVDKPPEKSIVVFVDEFSAKAKPYGGKSYSKVKSPDIVPKDYEVKGEIQIIGALKAHNPEVITHFSDTKRHTDVIELFKKLRQKYAQKTIYVVLDNARAHIANGLKDYLKTIGNTIKLVYLPTYSPWLNPIEAVWGVMKKAVLHNSDFPSINELIDAITKYFEYKNKKIEQAV